MNIRGRYHDGPRGVSNDDWSCKPNPFFFFGGGACPILPAVSLSLKSASRDKSASLDSPNLFKRRIFVNPFIENGFDAYHHLRIGTVTSRTGCSKMEIGSVYDAYENKHTWEMDQESKERSHTKTQQSRLIPRTSQFMLTFQSYKNPSNTKRRVERVYEPAFGGQHRIS